MNKQVKKKWLAALRSGKYHQGQKLLKQVQNKKPLYCCLGVLCDLYSKEHKNVWKPATKLDPANSESYIGEYFVLPEKVMEWAGLKQRNPIIENGISGESSLGEENDRGCTFEEIAKIIEVEL